MLILVIIKYWILDSFVTSWDAKIIYTYPVFQKYILVHKSGSGYLMHLYNIYFYMFLQIYLIYCQVIFAMKVCILNTERFVLTLGLLVYTLIRIKETEFNKYIK